MAKKDMPVRVDTIRGPWTGFGFHVDFQKKYVDIHFHWWIITLGFDDYWRINHYE